MMTSRLETLKSPCSPCSHKDFWRILGRRLNTFDSLTTAKHFKRILEILVKSKEYADPFLHFYQFLMTFKWHFFQKILLGIWGMRQKAEKSFKIELVSVCN
jgi:hypothetical protein